MIETILICLQIFLNDLPQWSGIEAIVTDNFRWQPLINGYSMVFHHGLFHMKLGNVDTGKHIACVDWARERYGLICVGFYPSNLSEHIWINAFRLDLLLPPWRGDICSIHQLFTANRLLYILWQYKLQQNSRGHDRRPLMVVLHLPPVERLGSCLYFKSVKLCLVLVQMQLIYAYNPRHSVVVMVTPPQCNTAGYCENYGNTFQNVGKNLTGDH